MSIEKRLERLIENLETFDLEVFFHDDTFVQIYEDRLCLEKKRLLKQKSKRCFISNRQNNR
jgi:hypothetical protein